MTREDIQILLQKKYDQNDWKNFLQSHFVNNKILIEPIEYALEPNKITKKCYFLGDYQIDEYTKIGLFEIQINDDPKIHRNRVGLRNVIGQIINQRAGAMVVFVQGNKWRFSYISKRKVKNKNTNLIEVQETAPKRFTYLFGHGEKARTASERFEKLINKQKESIFQDLTLNDFEEAFNVEKLGKDFFNNYKEIYEDFVESLTGKRIVKKGSKWIETKTSEPNPQLKKLFTTNEPEREARDFCKRMMGRIVFLYFIQKKGWLAVSQSKKWGDGETEYLYDLFKNANNQDDFYSKELVPLFFTTLNDPNSENETKALRFPYLNGGLFDNSLDKKYNDLKLPSKYFDKLFDIFNKFNFTIHEDAPDEQTVAVDPEMLGHIFENLLEDNKDKGAFYTPKEIVHYMCRESLHNYIYTYTKNEDNESFKTKLKQYNDTYDVELFTNNELKQINRALEDVKICDPAIGSGAFPMGLLHEIYNLKIPIEDKNGLKAKSPADIKKKIIEQSIYGVDIDSGAVDIARLRFWLSLVVDEEKPNPLPNLDFKIVCANTLIPSGYDSFIEIAQKTQTPTLLRMDGEIQKLQAIRDDYFDEDNKECKNQLKADFVATRTYILDEFKSLKKSWNLGDFMDKIATWEPFEDKSCAWFDPLWMFGITDGFDIVIGNPPYVNVEKISKDIKDNIKHFKTAYQKYDLYVLFFENGLNLLKQKGILSFITSNKFLSQGYGLLLRQLFLKYTINEIINFNYDIFENATVRTCILSIQKYNASDNHKIKVIDINSISDANKFYDKNYSYLNQSVFNETDQNNFRINLTDEKIKILNEIKLNTFIVEEICSVNYGIRPSSEKLNLKKEAFIYDSNKDSKFKPYFEGKDMGYWLIAKSAFIDYQPSVMYNPMFKELFEMPKLVGLRTLSDITKLRFIYDENKFYCNDAVVVLSFWEQFEKVNYLTVKRLITPQKIQNSKQFNYQFLQSILNSKLIKFYVNELMYDGTHFYPNHMKALPIKKYELNKQSKFSNLVKYLFYLNKENEPIISHTENIRIASHIEDVLNMMVFELYFTDHMKEVGIDVLQFINPEPITDKDTDSAKGKIIAAFYSWYQKPDNPVRQRLLLVDTRSKDKIALINKSL